MAAIVGLRSWARSRERWAGVLAGGCGFSLALTAAAVARGGCAAAAGGGRPLVAFWPLHQAFARASSLSRWGVGAAGVALGSSPKKACVVPANTQAHHSNEP